MQFQPSLKSFNLPDEPAENDEDAEQRYKLTIDIDPFPDLPAALLNSADVFDYVRATGLIYPFDIKYLKACSYEVGIGNKYIYWSPDGKKNSVTLGDEEPFELEPNSIFFVTTEEKFRLPHYIAARFNLRITNVHRGILLGTGPLVDPGFKGKLLIPLHNLTNNTYPFRQGEKFAWFEFTKVSRNIWDPQYQEQRKFYDLKGIYKPFPAQKSERDPNFYLNKAWHGSIGSSIPAAVDSANKTAKSAEDIATTTRKRLGNLQLTGFIAIFLTTITILIAAFAIVIPTYQLVREANTFANEKTSGLHLLSDKITRFEEERTKWEQQINELQESVDVLHNQISEIKKHLKSTNNQ